MNLGGSLKHIELAFRRNGDRMLGEYGLTTSQMRMMLFLFHRTDEGREVIQRDIEDALKLKTPTVSGTLDRLEKNGFLRRVPAPDNRRANRIVLTQRSEAMKQTSRAAMEEFERRVLSPLSEAEQATLQDMLRRISENLPE